MPRILLVEDNLRLAELIGKALAKVGFELDLFTSIATALQAIRLGDYGAIILDRGLPDGDGLSLIKLIRSEDIQTPCLMLTALDAVHDRINGLESGADDYLTKPFAMEEMIARIRALIRRPPALQNNTPSFGDVILRLDSSHLYCRDLSASLPYTELQIIAILLRAAGGAVRRSALEKAAWGLGEAVTPNALDVALHRLRKKLLLINSKVEIQNIRGLGYALNESPD